jgi:hypothetical protein
MTGSDLILYSTEDGLAQFALRQMEGQAWMTQLEMAELYQTSKQNISLHVQNVLAEGELAEDATVKENLTVQTEGSRQVRRKLSIYALPMIIAVGYRVRSTRGTQFRQWATRTLGEYLHKGFVMDDARLKEPRWDYFDELLKRIRDIRASEKRFYQKVRDLFTLAEDYRANEQDTALLFAEVQNKLFFAVSGHTAAELIVQRADSSSPNMNLLSFKGDRVRKVDVVVAKNYLNADELDKLNRLVSMFLDFAELRAEQRRHLVLSDWRQYIDSFMAFNEQPLLRNAGSVSHEHMKQVAHERYEQFDQHRRQAEALAADAQEMVELERLEKRLGDAKKSR